LSTPNGKLGQNVLLLARNNESLIIPGLIGRKSAKRSQL
jgi:hypothetical protein